MPPKTKPAAPEKADTTVEQKLAYLLLSTIKNSDLVYTERFERNGKIGFKIEAPGIVVVEAILDGNTLRIDPPSFGDSEGASRIRSEYESWMSKT
jgi:Cu2+-containing amine oxidase